MISLCPADLSVGIFHSFQVRIADAFYSVHLWKRDISTGHNSVTFQLIGNMPDI